MRILVTGGAGFVGSTLALSTKRDRNEEEVIAFDNLHRRGSELALQRLREGGVLFHHGDIRNPEDLEAAGPFDLMIECSAEPSVHAGYDQSPAYILNSNLVGTINCLEAVRRQEADMVFLSTSRVYPIDPLSQLPFEVRGQRYVVPSDAAGPGWSEAGVSTDFPLQGNRSMYGATKLCSELLIQEYGAMYGLRAVVNRCSVVAGPWQMGKVDQGFVVLWAARHLYGGALSYIGFGGQGHQVRDVLHVEDLYDLVHLQLADLDHHAGQVYNVGGGPERSVSLAELTELCAAKAPSWGATDGLSVGSILDTGLADIPYYVTDNEAVTAATSWRPKRSLEVVIDEIFQWLHDQRTQLEPILK